MIDTILSVVVLSAIALFAGAIYLWCKGVTKQASLMAILAFVMIANVLVWTVPSGDGPSLVESASE